MRLIQSVPAVLIALALAARPAMAQDAAECSVDTYRPTQLAQAGITIGRAAAAATPEDATRALRDAMNFLKDEKKIASNPVGVGFLKAQIYILWLHQDSGGDVLTNERLNAPGPKSGTVDLVVAADSLLKQVEAQGPACVAATAQWRQSKPWTDRLNKAYQFLSAEAVDSAEFYVKRAALLSANSPYVHNALAQIADKRGDKTGLLSHLKVAIALARGDTSMTETRRQMEFQYATTLHQYALGAGAADKDALLKESVDVFMGLLQENPSASEAPYAFSAASEIVALQQDTARSRQMLEMVAADASKYNDLTLLIAADRSRLLQRDDDAVTFYAAALAQNPNIRDANYFLAFMYYEKKDAAKMAPLTAKLVEIDPSNPDNYLLQAEGIKLLALAEKDAAKKAALIKQAEVAARIEATMPHKLLVTQFERRAEGALLRGNVENRGKTAKAYTVAMDFLDVTGAVVESVTFEVPAVKPAATGEFSIEATKPGIVAYRYSPLK